MLSLSCFPLAGALILMKLIMGRVWGPKSLRDYLASDNNSLRWVWFGTGAQEPPRVMVSPPTFAFVSLAK